ncbi:MAG: branched-chain amino acid ABC transporter permease [Chloroflexi bacterium]|nr:branched-chain amino acid ABC transporter permease [Chloroflexota bacterium]
MNPELLIQSVVLGILTGGVYALMASGLTLIFGIMRVVNVAHGAMIVMAAYVSWVLYKTFNLDPIASIVVVMPIFFVAGALVQWTILRRLGGRDLTLTVLVTFGFAIILEGLQGSLWSSSFQAINTPYSLSSFEIGGIYVPLVRLLAAGVALVLLGALYLLLARSNLGRAIRATTQDPRTAALVGVNVEQVTMLAFALGVSMAAAAGPLLGMIFAFYPATHWLWIGKLLAIVVLGGLGSLAGTFVAAMILGLAEQVATVTVSLDWAPMVFYIFLFGVLIVRPRGLFGTTARESL